MTPHQAEAKRLKGLRRKLSELKSEQASNVQWISRNIEMLNRLPESDKAWNEIQAKADYDAERRRWWGQFM